MTVTLITGASSGLGAETARQLAAKGHDLALCARRTDRLEELTAEITAAHDVRVEHRALDVDDHDAVREVVQAFAADFGGLDRVVVNAGIGKGAKLGTGRFDANRDTLLTNVVGALAQIEAALEVFRAQERGHLVLVSSVAALRGLPRAQTAYAASKAALAHLGEGLQMELHGTDISVTVLYPGYIDSEMNHGNTSPLMVSTEKGVRAMVAAMEKGTDHAVVPALPWSVLGRVLEHAPRAIARRLV
ncbi:SDR family oxidoreductase [Nocardioidaceae bacterium]|nr:SDR family oxidoreductase [Nocardioidaceae bacterium]